MSAFTDLGSTAPLRIWDGVLGRTIHGERVTFSVIELDPGVAVPEHSHANEQLGVVLKGALAFTVDGETRDLGPGLAWCITAHRPHSVVAGPDGAVLVEVFSPVRDDWAGLETEAPRPLPWP